ncbi:CPBP family intramembrane glutamic endopeptidase [Dysosmobacter sp.]
MGIAFFFITEAIEKTPKNESGLRLEGFFSDLKKPSVLVWVLLPVATAIIPFVLDDLTLHMNFAEHVLGRTDGMLSFENVAMLVFQVIILAWGEEIAWRGFFVGKSMGRFPFWLCAIVSSLLFAIGHISDGAAGAILYDIGFVFIDSMIFAVIYKKSGNCLVSTVSHIIGNAVGLAYCFIAVLPR